MHYPRVAQYSQHILDPISGRVKGLWTKIQIFGVHGTDQTICIVYIKKIKFRKSLQSTAIEACDRIAKLIYKEI